MLKAYLQELAKILYKASKEKLIDGTAIEEELQVCQNGY